MPKKTSKPDTGVLFGPAPSKTRKGVGIVKAKKPKGLPKLPGPVKPKKVRGV